MKDNRRVKMTKHLIKDAFTDLMEKSPINKITVKRICEVADVNRSTFYAHYSDQYELFEEIQEDIINLTPPISLYKKEVIFNDLKNFFNFINDNKKLYKIIFKNSTGMYFRNRILSKVFNRDDKDTDWISGEMDLGDSMHFKMLMCAFGGMTMIEKWIFEEFDISAENMATYMTQFIEKA